jgi:hypothetical protein
MDAAAACVLVLDSTGQAVATAATESNGDYTVEGVPAGSWAVEFVPDEGCLGANTVDAFQYYAGTPTQALATLVNVVAGQDTSGIDATLQRGATVQGSVASATGEALPGVCAQLEDTAGVPVVRQPTDTEGDYRIAQLPAGRFVLQFVDDGCVGRAQRYASTFFGGATLAEATVFTLRAGTLASPLNAVLDPLPPGSEPAPGGGATPGRQGPTARPPHTPAPTGKVARRAVLSLIRRPSGRWNVDRKHRLRLPVRCAAHGPVCVVTVSVNRVRRSGIRLLAGSPAGSRSVTLKPGKTRTIVIALHGVHAGSLWISVHAHDKRLMLQTVISVSWPNRARVVS